MTEVPPVIVALDYPEKSPALKLAARLAGRVAYLKVGLELYTAEGPSVIGELAQAGHRVFADLKLHDIPNTVSRAAKAVRRAGASMLTVHASGGTGMMRAAWDGAGPEVSVLGVTVLTSLGQADLAGTGVAGHVIDQVLRLAALASEAGLSGVVASPREAARLRAVHKPPFLVVTPGVRPAWDPAPGDQARVSSPRQAILSGADFVVVGRPVTGAADPVEAVERIGEETLAALRERGRPRPFGERLE
ncbi:MAG: orotidine-5'-phosphate decarboxylase [Bacillota bacterium]|nr:MAG: orotidine-5'-phosphate decarboxylase [Bacillota bacterium]